jgi:hypothetical protein
MKSWRAVSVEKLDGGIGDWPLHEEKDLIVIYDAGCGV